MKLIVGLGNPGREYRDTRHNVGFLVVDELARRYSLTLGMAPGQLPDTLLAKRYGEHPLLLAKPLTFMNRSGEAVAGLTRYYDIAAADLLVVVDEAALPFGRLRARARGSAGGHNGLKSVIERLGTGGRPGLLDLPRVAEELHRTARVLRVFTFERREVSADRVLDKISRPVQA